MNYTLQQLQDDIQNAFNAASEATTMESARQLMSQGIAQAISNFVVGRTITGETDGTNVTGVIDE